MAIAIVVLNTGERVITDLQEIREDNKEDGKPICLMFMRPYILNVEGTDDATVNQEVQVRFSKWLPYSSDTQFKIPFSSVMAVGTADTGLAQAYMQTVEQAITAEKAVETANPAGAPAPPAGTAATGFVPGDPNDPANLPDGSVDPDYLDSESDGQDTTT